MLDLSLFNPGLHLTVVRPQQVATACLVVDDGAAAKAVEIDRAPTLLQSSQRAFVETLESNYQ